MDLPMLVLFDVHALAATKRGIDKALPVKLCTLQIVLGGTVHTRWLENEDDTGCNASWPANDNRSLSNANGWGGCQKHAPLPETSPCWICLSCK